LLQQLVPLCFQPDPVAAVTDITAVQAIHCKPSCSAPDYLLTLRSLLRKLVPLCCQPAAAGTFL
jgi:hypothetical protein